MALSPPPLPAGWTHSAVQEGQRQPALPGNPRLCCAWPPVASRVQDKARRLPPPTPPSFPHFWCRAPSRPERDKLGGTPRTPGADTMRGGRRCESGASGTVRRDRHRTRAAARRKCTGRERERPRATCVKAGGAGVQSEWKGLRARLAEWSSRHRARCLRNGRPHWAND